MMNKIIILLFLLSTTLDLSRCRSIADLEEDMDNVISISEPLPQYMHNDWVKISQPPKLVIKKNVGGHVELECEAMGSPPPIVQWFKEERTLTFPFGIESNVITESATRGLAKVKARIIINYLLPVHKGTYRCVAQSGSEKSVAESRILPVYQEGVEMNLTTFLKQKVFSAHRKPRVTLWSPTYMDDIGKEVFLPCQSVGNPKPDIMWLDPQGQLIDREHGRVSVQQDGQLRIRSVSWSDMGVYSCVARNSAGQDSSETFLYPMQES